MVVGRLEYMSPEKLRAEEPDPKSDTYSLGLIFWTIACTG